MRTVSFASLLASLTMLSITGWPVAALSDGSPVQQQPGGGDQTQTGGGGGASCDGQDIYCYPFPVSFGYPDDLMSYNYGETGYQNGSKSLAQARPGNDTYTSTTGSLAGVQTAESDYTSQSVSFGSSNYKPYAASGATPSQIQKLIDNYAY